MQKILKRLSLVLLCCLTLFFGEFIPVVNNLVAVKPLVVNADDLGSQIKSRWYEFLAIASALGLTYSIEWTQQQINSIVDKFVIAQPNTSMDLSGSSKKSGDDLIVNNAVVQGAVKFWDWFCDYNNIEKEVAQVKQIALQIDTVPSGGTYAEIPSGTTCHFNSNYWITFTSSGIIRAVGFNLGGDNSSYHYYFVSNQTLTEKDSYNNISIYHTNFDGYSIATSNPASPVASPSIPMIVPKSGESALNLARLYTFGGYAEAPAIPTTNIDVNNLGDTSGIKDIDKNDNLLLPGLGANIPADVVGSDGTVAIPVTNDAIQQKIKDDAIATPIDTSIPATFPLADTVNPTTVQPVDTTYNPPSTPDSEKYKVVGLSDIFPFCIPFDLVNFIGSLKATPEAPVVTIPLHFAGIIDYELTIDLNTFNAVAAASRAVELALTIVGLMFISKGMLGDK